jgi:hypothetical protein
MKHHGIPGSMGRLADGDAFFDREEVLARAWDLLKTSNLLLLAPRRVGKSSLLNRMRKDGEAQGYKTLYLSVPDAEDELDFIRRLTRAIRDADWAPGGWFEAFRSKLPDDLEFVLKASLIELKAKNFDWRKPAEALEDMLGKADNRTLLLIDELPLLVGSIVQQDPNGARAERFLLWLKRLREQYQPRWFFAGSIGLDSVARRLRLSGTIHDLMPVELGEFAPDKARAYLALRAEFHGLKLLAATIDSILAAVEWPIPFYLNLVFEEVRAVVGEGRGTPSPEMVEQAIGRLLKNGRTHFDHWDERLQKLFEPGFATNCEIVLTMASAGAHGVQVSSLELRLSPNLPDATERARLLRNLLDFLISDGYLIRHNDRVRFRSALLRRYWLEVQA